MAGVRPRHGACRDPDHWRDLGRLRHRLSPYRPRQLRRARELHRARRRRGADLPVGERLHRRLRAAALHRADEPDPTPACKLEHRLPLHARHQRHGEVGGGAVARQRHPALLRRHRRHHAVALARDPAGRAGEQDRPGRRAPRAARRRARRDRGFCAPLPALESRLRDRRPGGAAIERQPRARSRSRRAYRPARSTPTTCS